MPHRVHQLNWIMFCISSTSLHHVIQLTPFSSLVESFTIADGNPFVLIDPEESSLEFVILAGSDNLVAGSSVFSCCCRISIRLKDGTSPLQYLCHMLRYVDSKARAKLDPSQTGDLDIKSRRLILKFERAVTSEANCSANWTYSSSVFATRCPNPVLQSPSSHILMKISEKEYNTQMENG